MMGERTVKPRRCPKSTGPQDPAINPRRYAQYGPPYCRNRRLRRLTTRAKKIEMSFAHLKGILKLDHQRLR